MKRKVKMNRGVMEAIERAGSQVALAELLKVSQPAVNHWLYENLPAEKAIQVSKATGVDLHQLRPDLFAA